MVGYKVNPESNIHLGLDLKGGAHLVMRVKTEEFLKHLTEGNAVAAQNAAQAAGFQIKEAHADISGGNYRVLMTPADSSKASEIKDAVEKKVEVGDRSGWAYSASGDQLSWSLTGAAQRTLSDDATQQALENY